MMRETICDITDEALRKVHEMGEDVPLLTRCKDCVHVRETGDGGQALRCKCLGIDVTEDFYCARGEYRGTVGPWKDA